MWEKLRRMFVYIIKKITTQFLDFFGPFYEIFGTTTDLRNHSRFACILLSFNK